MTPRGSGTSGYVTTNKFNLHRAPPARHSERSDEATLLNRGPNKEILDHNRKRELELEVAKQQDELEAEGWVVHLASRFQSCCMLSALL